MGGRAWVLTLVASGLTMLMLTVAYCMVCPVRFDGLGKLGLVALYFPLHLLLVTVLAGALDLLAWRWHARLAAWVLGLVMVLTVIMALAPTIALWRRALALDVPLSVGTYLAQAGHVNVYRPQLARSVVYGSARDGAKLQLDVWQTGRPNAGPSRPAIVFVHGGAWTHGNRSMHADWDRWLNEIGYEVFDVEYRMPPQARWLDEVGDVKAALGWVAAHAAEYHVDPKRISMMGNSAGGNLSMLAAYSMGDPQLPPSDEVPSVAIRSMVNLYGPADLALLYRVCPSTEYVQAAFRQYVGGSPEQFPDRYRALSPLTHVTAKAPPTITLLGTSDRLVATEQAELLNQALSVVGVPHEMYLLPASDHGFDANWGAFGTQIARAKIKAFLERYDH